MKIVFLVHYFPPLNSAGSRRIIGFARFLNEGGHEVVVVTTNKKFLTSSDGESAPKKIKTITLGGNATGVKKPFIDKYSIIDRTKIFEAMRDIKRWLSGYLGQLPDSRLLFALRFIHPVFHREAVGELRDADVIISSSPPWPMHLAGLLIRFRYKKTWLLDYRDAFSENHIFQGSLISRWIEAKLDRLFCYNADGVSTVSEPISKYYAQRFCALTRTISNGFNPYLFEVGDPGPINRVGGASFVIRYIGTIYKIELVPRSVFDILSKHVNNNFNSVGLEFIGDCSLVSDIIKNEYPELHSRVKVFPKVRHDMALQLMKSADALLFIETSSNGSATAEGILTTKLFEYIACARPILAIVQKDTLMSEILLSSGLCLDVSTDPIRIESCLRALVSKEFELKPNIEFINKYSQRHNTQILVDWLDALISIKKQSKLPTG